MTTALELSANILAGSPLRGQRLSPRLAAGDPVLERILLDPVRLDDETARMSPVYDDQQVGASSRPRSGAQAWVRWVGMEIRPLVAADATAIHRSLLGDPEVAAWFRSSGPFTLAECEEMVTRKVAHRVTHRFGWSLGWDGDTCIGWSVAQSCIIDGVSEVEIGWTVARSHWRRGVASRLGQHALTEVSSLGLRSIVAYTRTDNVASRGVMTKLGMSCEKSFDFHGEPHVLYRKPLTEGPT